MRKGRLKYINKALLKIPDQIILTSVPEETLIKAKEVEDKSRFFHSEDKGCNLEDQLVFSNFDRRYIEIKFCKTHQASCCRCGWEFGYHYDTNSKMLSCGYEGAAEYKCKCKVCGEEFIAHRKNAFYCKNCRFKVLREQTKNYHLKLKQMGGKK